MKNDQYRTSTMDSARDWRNRLRKLGVHFQEYIEGNMCTLNESHLTLLSELASQDVDHEVCLSALAEASVSLLLLNEEWLAAFERSRAPLDPGSPKAIEALISTMQRCGYSPDLQKAVVRLVGGELDAASGPEHIRSTDEEPGPPQKTAVSTSGPENVGSTDVKAGRCEAPESGYVRHHSENITSSDVMAGQAEKQPEAPPEPISFKSQEDLTDFIVKVLPNVNERAREMAQAKNDAEMKTFKEQQALKRELLSPGEIYVDEHFLREALESVQEILERLPDIEGDLVGEVNEAAIRAWSRLNMVLRWGTKDDEDEDDLDDSDNESGEAAQ